MLLDLGLDPNGANNDGRTPLMGAALKGRNDVVQLLVDRGAKLDQRDGGSRDTDNSVSKLAGPHVAGARLRRRPGPRRRAVGGQPARDGGAHSQADDRPRAPRAAAQPRRRIHLRRVDLPGRLRIGPSVGPCRSRGTPKGSTANGRARGIGGGDGLGRRRLLCVCWFFGGSVSCVFPFTLRNGL